MSAAGGGETPSARTAVPPGDYHVHTTFSDGTGSVAECVARAVDLGLPEIGVADHLAPVQLMPWETATIPFAHLERYVAEVREEDAAHPGIKVLLGVEVDYVPGQGAALDAVLASYPFDYLVGGVHVVDGFAFDEPALRHDSRWSDPDALLAEYYRAVRGAAECGRFDVIAHLDYIGLWGHTPGPAVVADIAAALDAIAAAGSAIELNTDRISDPAGVMYPSPAVLRAACERDIPLVISSDAHEADHVGRLWGEGIALARASGYRETLRLSDRAMVPLPAS